MKRYTFPKRERRRALGLAGLCLVAVIAGCKPSGPDPKTAGSAGPLDLGWEFACALTDPVDAPERGASQEKVAMARLAGGDAESAQAYALQIGDWRRGIVLIQIADWLAERGETAKAEALLPQIEVCELMTKEWQRDFYRAALIRLRALLGREQEVVGAVSNFTGNANIGGDTIGSLALMLARTGRVDDAKVVLNNLEGMKGLNIAASRTQGYLDLVAAGRLDPETAPGLLTNAWEATAGVMPYRRWELQMTIIQGMVTNGLPALAREHLEDLGSNVVAAVKLPPEVGASILSQGAVAWSRLKEPGRGVDLLRAAEEGVKSRLEPMFQPGAYASLAEGYAAIGDAGQARALYAQALEISCGLPYVRPRALAGVDVCVSLAGHKELIDAGIQKGLDRLRASFHATQP